MWPDWISNPGPRARCTTDCPTQPGLIFSEKKNEKIFIKSSAAVVFGVLRVKPRINDF